MPTRIDPTKVVHYGSQSIRTSYDEDAGILVQVSHLSSKEDGFSFWHFCQSRPTYSVRPAKIRPCKMVTLDTFQEWLEKVGYPGHTPELYRAIELAWIDQVS